MEHPGKEGWGGGVGTGKEGATQPPPISHGKSGPPGPRPRTGIGLGADTRAGLSVCTPTDSGNCVNVCSHIQVQEKDEATGRPSDHEDGALEEAAV